MFATIPVIPSPSKKPLMKSGKFNLNIVFMKNATNDSAANPFMNLKTIDMCNYLHELPVYLNIRQ
jgi:hypothetical protein